jgi:exodeoxyribonuclease-5
MYGFKFITVLAELSNTPNVEIEFRLLMDTLFSETPNLPRERQDELYKNVALDYENIKAKNKKVKLIRENPYFNALQIKYAYAVTAHKAQGGQWKHVYIDASFFRYIAPTVDNLKWLYTAITRATEKVYIIDMPTEAGQ